MKLAYLPILIGLSILAPSLAEASQSKHCQHSDTFAKSEATNLAGIHRCADHRSLLKRYQEDIVDAEKKLNQIMGRLSSKMLKCAETSEKHHNCMRRLSRSSKDKVKAGINALRSQEVNLQRRFELIAKELGRFRTVFQPHTKVALQCKHQLENVCTANGHPGLSNGIKACTACASNSEFKYWKSALAATSMENLTGARKEHQTLARAYRESLTRVRKSLVGGYNTFGQLAGSEYDLAKYEVGLRTLEASDNNPLDTAIVYSGTTTGGQSFQIFCSEGECKAISKQNLILSPEVDGLVKEFQAQRFGVDANSDERWLFTDPEAPNSTKISALDELGLGGEKLTGPLQDNDDWQKRFVSTDTPADDIVVGEALVKKAKLEMGGLDTAESGELKGRKYWEALDELNGNFEGVKSAEVNGDLRQRIRDLELRLKEPGISEDEKYLRAQELEFAKMLKTATKKDDVLAMQQKMSEFAYDLDGNAVSPDLDKMFLVDGENGARTRKMGLDMLEHLSDEEKRNMFSQMGLAKDLRPVVDTTVAAASGDAEPIADVKDRTHGEGTTTSGAGTTTTVASGIPDKATPVTLRAGDPVPAYMRHSVVDPTKPIIKNSLTGGYAPTFNRETAAENLALWFDSKDANYSKEVANEIVRNCKLEDDDFSACVYTMASTFGAESNFMKGYKGNYPRKLKDGSLQLTSYAGARGAMQIMPNSAKWMEGKYGDQGCEGTTSNFKLRLDTDVCYNVAMSYNHFKYQADHLGQPWGSAAQKAGYNWGPHRRTLKQNPYATTAYFTTGSRVPKETRQYLTRNTTFTNELADHMKDLQSRYLSYVISMRAGL